MHGVAGAFGDYVAEEGAADEGEVSDEVEGLVAATFVGEAEAFGVHDLAFGGEADGVGEGGAADEAHFAELVELFFEPEGAGGGEFAGVVLWGDVHLDGVLADGGGEVDVAGEAETVVGEDGDALATFLDGDGAADAEVAAFAAELADASGAEHIDEGLAAAVDDGDFEVVEFEGDVVDAEAVEGAEEVFGGGNEDALAHEAGGVADAGDVFIAGGDGEIVEVGAAENDTGAGGGGGHAQLYGDTAV